MDFSKMLHEMLDIIAHKHITFYEDYYSFALVCKSWHSSALYVVTKRNNNYNGPPSRFPSLMLSVKEEAEEFRELFLFSNKSIRKIRIPGAYKFCMSSCGWLVTKGLKGDDSDVTNLINPLSHEIISLPKIYFPYKVVFVPQSSLVVVVAGLFQQLGFCRIGDNKWTCIENLSMNKEIYDITYYNGRVYSVDGNNFIKACDVIGEDPINLVYVSRMAKDLLVGWYFGTDKYIFGYDGDDGGRKLLVVIRRLCDKGFVTKSFKVFEYDLENEKWSEVKDLGRKTLFVGYSCSSFWIEDTTGVIKENCIYYTSHGSEKYCGTDMGIYRLSDGMIEPLFVGESRSMVTPQIWLQPSIH